MKKKLLIIVDNYEYEKGLKTDWGFSALLEVEGLRILFDLGNEPEIFAHNIEKLGVNLSDVDYLFISHYDSDHIGGLWHFLKRNDSAPILVPYNPEFQDLNEKLREEYGREVVVVSEPIPIGPRNLNIFSTGVVSAFPRPEHSLYLLGQQGWSIIAGCSHPKVWNIAERVKELTKSDHIDMYIGGYHFYRLKGQELKDAVKKVVESGIRRSGACHCTGNEARELLKEIYGENFIEIGVGRVLEWY